MEWWNDGILVFKRILTILILSSIPPVAEPLIQHCIILSESEANTHYSSHALAGFQHSKLGTRPGGVGLSSRRVRRIGAKPLSYKQIYLKFASTLKQR